MSSRSNVQGRAYEFKGLLVLKQEISNIRTAAIVKNSSYTAAGNAWNTLSGEDKNIYAISTTAAVKRIFDLVLHPRLKVILTTLLQSCKVAKMICLGLRNFVKF
ncbi:MAG: HaeIII family restriction endonuclease [Muribaculaceae bacterium]|nr:HaeIII family restriction endonuclease [Muribaculaceae bacterium]